MRAERTEVGTQVPVEVDQIDRAIARIRDEDCDFLTPDTLVAYTGCTERQATERLALATVHLAASHGSPLCGASHRHGVMTTLIAPAATCLPCRAIEEGAASGL